MEDNKQPATDYIEDYMSEQPMVFAFQSVAKSRRHHRPHHHHSPSSPQRRRIFKGEILDLSEISCEINGLHF